MASKQEQALRKQQMSLARVTFIAGLVIFVGAGFIWFNKVYSNANNVFWGMVDSSFSSYGRSSTVKQSNGGQNIEQEQTTRLQLGAQNVAMSESRLIQNGGTDNEVIVTTQSIGTPTKNFTRYSEIDIRQKLADGSMPDFSKIENTWASEEILAPGNSSFVQAIYGSLGHIPVGNLSAKSRQELVDYIKKNKVYDIKSFNKESRNNRSVYVYEAEVNMAKYVTMLKMFDAAIGLEELKGVEPKQFENQEPIQVTLAVDILNRDLVEFSYKGAAQSEKLGSYGAVRSVGLPGETISSQELQQTLQTILSGGSQ